MTPMMILGLLCLTALQPGAQEVPASAETFPALEGPAEMLRGDLPSLAAEPNAHEALRDPSLSDSPAPVRAEFEPPSPVPERPGGIRPSPDATWIGGYWDWDEARQEFGWVSGVWSVPPPEKTWVAGRWLREGQSWTRIPGSWRSGHDWREQGPPAEHPPATIGSAPSPDHFLVPGHYAPQGDAVAWKPGFWARAQPGWDWIPAHWVRRADGWAFLEGRWARATPDAGQTAAVSSDLPASRLPATVREFPRPQPSGGLQDPAKITNYVVARPAADGSTDAGDPASIASRPAGDRGTFPPLRSTPVGETPGPGGDPAGPVLRGGDADLLGRSLVPGADGLPPGYRSYPPGTTPPPGPRPPSGPANRGVDPNRRGEQGANRRPGGPPRPFRFLQKLTRPNRR